MLKHWLIPLVFCWPLFCLGRDQPVPPTSHKPAPAYAKDINTPPYHLPHYAKTAKNTLQQVLQDPVFGKNEKKKRWRFKNPFHFKSREKPQNEYEWETISAWIKRIVSWLARFLEVVLWVIAAGVIGLIIHTRSRWLPFLGWINFKLFKRKPSFLVTQNFNIEPLQDQWPADICQEVLNFWKSGEQLAALSLLYRATLRDLTLFYHLELPAGATESEIVNRVAVEAQPVHLYISHLTAAWQRSAYAHQPYERMSELLRDYQHLFAKERV